MAKQGMTINELAKLLGTSKQNLRIILSKNKKKKVTPDTSFKAKDSRALLYPYAMAEALKSAYDADKFGKRRGQGAGKPAKVSIKTKIKNANSPLEQLMAEHESHKQLKHALKAFVNSVKHLLD